MSHRLFISATRTHSCPALMPPYRGDDVVSSNELHESWWGRFEERGHVMESFEGRTCENSNPQGRTPEAGTLLGAWEVSTHCGVEVTMANTSDSMILGGGGETDGQGGDNRSRVIKRGQNNFCVVPILKTSPPLCV